MKANYSVYFATLQDLLLALAKARAEDRLETKLRGLSKPKLSVINEVDYLSLDGWEVRMVFQPVPLLLSTSRKLCKLRSPACDLLLRL